LSGYYPASNQLSDNQVNKLSYSYLPWATRQKIAATSKIPASANQKNMVNPATSIGPPNAAVIIPIMAHSPPRMDVIKANTPIIEPPFYFS